MVAKLLRLSQITNGGEGSGESEGHPFRGNQYSSFNESLRDFKNRYRKSTVEHVVAYKDGKPIGESSGTQRKTTLPQVDLKDADLIHNHPGGSPALSGRDVIEAINNDMNSLSAVSGGEVWTLNRPEEGWPPHESYTVEKAFSISREEYLSSTDGKELLAKYRRGHISRGLAASRIEEAYSKSAIEKLGLTIVKNTSTQVKNIGIEDSITSIVKKYLDISTTNHQKKRIPKMVAKLLRLSQITNGGEGSGEHEGHEFRGNQYDGEGNIPRLDETYPSQALGLSTSKVKEYLSSRGISESTQKEIENAFDSHIQGNESQKFGDDKLSTWWNDPESEHGKALHELSKIEDKAIETKQKWFKEDKDKEISKLEKLSPSSFTEDTRSTSFRRGSDEHYKASSREYDAYSKIGWDPYSEHDEYVDSWKEKVQDLKDERDRGIEIHRRSTDSGKYPHTFKDDLSPADKERTVLSFTTRSGGAQASPITDPEESWSPNTFMSLSKLKDSGYEVISGMGMFRGYSGESEVIVMKSLDIKTRNTQRIKNLDIEDSIKSIVKKYLESNVDSSSDGISSSHLIGSLVAKGNLQENPMVSFDLLRQQSLDYAMEHTKTLIEKGGETIHGEFKPWLKDASEELRSSISTTITDGINKGKSRDQIKRDLRDIYAGDEARIDKIAGWEIPNAQYRGSMDQYKEDGITIFEWLLGDSPCDICEPYGEKRYFTAEELPQDLPHPRCQCDIAPVTSSQMVSMVRRLVHGGEGSGEHEGHEFRGNQWGEGNISSAKDSLKFERGSSAIFSSKMSNEETRDLWDSISNIKGRNIDEDELDALRGYQQSEYSNMNEVARTGEVKGYPDITDSVYNMNASMDLAIEHGSQVVPEGIEMWRGIGEKHGASVAAMEVGDICKDEGFQSFSIDPYVGGNFARAFVIPDSPTPTTIGKSLQTGDEHGLGKTVIRAISTGNEKALGGSMTERELIFPRGTSWQIVSKEQFDVGRGIKLNVVTVVHHG